jgi:hypothetical protein
MTLALSCSLLLAACTTVQTRTTGETDAVDVSKERLFGLAKQAALNAGMTITSVDQQSGFITATRGSNAALTWQNPVININIQENSDGNSIFIASTVGGQIQDYGTTASTIEDFCKSLNARLPKGNCTVKE